ncbi:MAG: hypothetical protein LBI05_08625, partial [Planctomycetaceae bacterium]|nr:hypothetical protein [Planctomycetaceae bacterium]
MLKTLARIASHTARGIYACLLLNGGSACRKELLEAGFTSSILHEAVLSLEAAGFIFRIGGTYRITGSAIPEDSSGMPEGGLKPASENSGRPEHSSGMPEHSSGIPEHLPPRTTALLESKSKRKYSRRPEHSSGMPEHSSGIPEHRAKSVNVVNSLHPTTQLHGVKVFSTKQFDDHWEFLKSSDVVEWKKLLTMTEELQKFIGIASLSGDIPIRLVLLEPMVGIKIPIDEISEWKNAALSAVRRGNVKSARIAFAATTKRYFENLGIKWTKCRPENVRVFDSKMDNLRKL